MFPSILLSFALTACTTALAADFDADGADDIVVGAWQEDVVGVSAGVVYPVYGHTSGLSAGWADRIERSEFGGTPEEYDYLGLVMATGDFDGDGHDDLALGVSAAESNSGIVYVVYGDRLGLDVSSVVSFEIGVDGILGVPTFAEFGSSLAAGDFDHDGCDDLAIGAAWESDPARKVSGSVHVLYGSVAGLGTTRNQLFSQGYGAGDTGEDYDYFGAALAAGDINGDGHDDLAIGARGERVGTSANAGAIHTLFGSRSGLTATTRAEITQDTSGVPDAVEPGDMFGYTLVIGDFNGADGCADLAIGTPLESVGTLAYAGTVTVLRGSRTGITSTGSSYFTQGTFGGTTWTGHQFGYRMAAGDLQGDGKSDLAIAEPYDDFGGLTQAGSVYIASGSSGSWRALSRWNKDTAGIEGTASTAGLYATSVTLADIDGNGKDDVILGSGNGELAFIRGDGSAAGLTTTGDQLLSGGTFGFPAADWYETVLR